MYLLVLKSFWIPSPLPVLTYTFSLVHYWSLLFPYAFSSSITWFYKQWIFQVQAVGHPIWHKWSFHSISMLLTGHFYTFTDVTAV